MSADDLGFRDYSPSEPAGALPQASTLGSAQAAMAAAAQQGSNNAPGDYCATCPERSLRFRLGWTFAPTQVPRGTYQLRPGMAAPAAIPASGSIVLDRASGVQVPAQVTRAELIVTLTDGPTYSFDVLFDLPPIHEPTGLKRRLTNLGLYAGTDDKLGGRALWALRAFKRIHMNRFARSATAPEDDMLRDGQPYTVSAATMAAVQAAHGAHPGDNTAALSVPANLLQREAATAPDAGMFGSAVLRRGSFETAGAVDDRDPRHGQQGATWAGNANPAFKASRLGYELCLGTYDEAVGQAPVENRVNLPQPVHMLQFALHEAGFWAVAGGRANGQTITAFGPTGVVATNAAGGTFGTMDGVFGRSLQWALREFQCHAKLPHAAVEDVTFGAGLYIQRLIRLPSAELTGLGRYPDESPASGALNDQTARALQIWLDNRYRCPVLLYAVNPDQPLDIARITQENIWRYNDCTTATARVYALDFSRNYTLPPEKAVTGQMDGQEIPMPIIVGRWTGYTQQGRTKTVTYGGPLTGGAQLWNLETTEVTPQTIYGRGGFTGTGLSAAQLSTFKVLRAAAHFECLGHFDSLNAYDRVTLSFGLCHWTLAVLDHDSNNPIPVEEGREMGALFSYMASTDGAMWQRMAGRFGWSAVSAWPITASGGAYTSQVNLASETGGTLLAGANYRNDRAQGVEDNRYGHTWPVYYRMLMANRTSPEFQRASGRFARQRIQNILDRSVGTGRIGDYLTSEKGVAMAYRAHIYTTSTLGRLVTRLEAIGRAHPAHNQARENLAMDAVEAAASGPAREHAATIRGWTNLPQRAGIMQGVTYRLNLDDATISGAINSFTFDPP